VLRDLDLLRDLRGASAGSSPTDDDAVRRLFGPRVPPIAAGPVLVDRLNPAERAGALPPARRARPPAGRLVRGDRGRALAGVRARGVAVRVLFPVR